jgi:hypothetical protein
MKPIEFKEVNKVFAKDQPEYNPLPCFHKDSKEGDVVSCWQLSDEELQKVNRTKVIWLSLWSFNKPLTPSLITVNKTDVIDCIEEQPKYEPFSKENPFWIQNTTKVKIGFKERIRILFGKQIIIGSTTYIDKEVEICKPTLTQIS